MTKIDRNLNLPVVQVADVQVQQIAYKGEPVVTFAMVDEIHQRADGTAKRNFHDNRDRFISGQDFIIISSSQKDVFRTFGIEVPNRGLTVLTERGYLKLVKPMQDDRAWQVQGEMIDCYFKVKTGAWGQRRLRSMAIRCRSIASIRSVKGFVSSWTIPTIRASIDSRVNSSPASSANEMDACSRVMISAVRLRPLRSAASESLSFRLIGMLILNGTVDSWVMDRK